MLKLLILALILLNFSLSAKACAFCSPSLGGLDAGSPVLSMSADTLAAKKLALGYSLQFLDVGQFDSQDYKSLNRSRTHGHSFNSMLVNTVNLAYGLNDDLSLIASYPYNAKYNLKYTYDGRTYNDGDSIGFGDLTLLAKYRLLKFKKSKINVSTIAGIRMPTGQSNERGTSGFKLAPDEQPSSGSWDPIMGLLVNKRFEKFTVDLNGIYKLSSPGTNDVIVGDSVNYNLAISGIFGSRKIFNQKITFAWSTEMNGLWRERVEYKGVKDNAHGGNTIFLSPGLRMSINDKLISSVSVSLPMIENLNGKQPDSNLMLFFSMNYVF